ncbi:MAG: cyclic nucleotide-binding domain-containing protein [Proteobacteria bacterium]|nr:cyclic nucleotide-binding domain-containing protein [Pseudomonadota bacterium]
MSASMSLSEANLLRLLNNITIFSGIGLHEQHMLASKCIIADWEAEKIVIEEGEIGDTLYAILKGQVAVTKYSSSKGQVKVNTLTVGDIFGEIAILRGIPRTARITTLTPCSFLTINAHDFLDAYQYFPPQSRDNIQLVIAKRLMQLRSHF